MIEEGKNKEEVLVPVSGDVESAEREQGRGGDRTAYNIHHTIASRCKQGVLEKRPAVFGKDKRVTQYDKKSGS